jgi:predicted DNA-binding transcriptional regulator YafY
MSKFNRMLYILNKLELGAKVKPEEIAKELGVSERTIYRYINSLIDAGFPIYYDKTRGSYVFAEGFSLRKALLEPEETLVLALSRRFLEPAVGDKAGEVLKQIEKKVILATKNVSIPGEFLGIQGTPRFKHLFNLLRDLFTAIKERRVVEIKYVHEPEEPPECREIEPYFVFYTGDFWYVEAWCRKKQAERTFALDKILSWRLTDRYFLPKTEVASVEEIQEAFGPYVDAEKEEVVVHFSPEVKQYFLRRKWVKEQEEKELSDGWLEVKFKVRGVHGFKKWLYRWIPYFKVISPDWLKEEIKKELETALSKI